MKTENLTMIFNSFEQEHLGKDPFLVPYYLGKYLRCETNIVYLKTKTNYSLPSVVRGVHLVPLGNKISVPLFQSLRILNFLWYLFWNARKIDLLMCFHYTLYTELLVCMYKFLNPHGKAYVKLDLNYRTLREPDIETKCSLKYWMKNYFSKIFSRCVDKVSCETSQAFELLHGNELPSSLSRYNFGDKLVLMPNGFDEETFQSYHIQEKTFEEKENLIITVGRLGTPEKNTDMFLRALSQVDLKDWKVDLIGPVENSFQPVIDAFFRDNPDKIRNVVFTGAIYDKQKLWEYYNRAKVFVLSSRWESYALVLNEAKRFRNYLLSTDVGAFRDLSANGKYGTSIPIDDDKRLAEVLEKIVLEEININVYKDLNLESLAWKEMVQLLEL